MMKKKFYIKITRIITVVLFYLCLTGCDSLYDSVFDKFLQDTIESETQYEQSNVEIRTLQSIYIKDNQIKTVYGIGDEFSTENIFVFAKYSNENELDVTDYVSYSGFSSSEENAEIIITVSYSENGVTVSTTFTVAVFNNYIRVQSLVFEEDYKNSVIGLGNSRQLQVTVLPENANVKTVNWKSSDSSIASVTKDGIVTALKEGFVTITAISVDNPEVTAECSVEAKYYHAESVVINKADEQVRIEIEKTYNLSAIVEPELAPQQVIWSSSDEKIATVSQNGVVSAHKLGTAIITATSADRTDVKDSCEIEVFKYDVESLVLDKKELNILVHTTGELSAEIGPENATYKDYVWSSSDENVATVDQNGVINALKVGKTTIAVTSVDNEDIKDSCEVTVFKYNVENIILNTTELNLFVDTFETLSVTIEPENATYKDYVWTSSDENVAIISDDGLVTAVNGGEAELTVTSVDNPEVKDICRVTVTQIDSLEPQNYQIGDVILKNGTFVSYDDVDQMTDVQKSMAVAVIYGYKTELMETGTESYALGVGLDYSNNLAWCSSSSPGYNMDFEELYSSSTYDYVYDENGSRHYIYQFSGNTDGSDAWEYICSMDSVGTADPATYYPAWNYVINYGKNKQFKGFYKNNWYMPSLKEISKLYQSLNKINNLLQACGGKKLTNNYYEQYFLTSSTCSNNYIWSLYTYDERIMEFEEISKAKTSYSYIIPLKAFPCSVIHYEDYVTNTITVTYPSFTQSSIKLTSSTDDDGNYTFTVAPSTTNGQLEEGATYRWVLDTTLFTSSQMPSDSQLSEDGTSLILPRSYLSSLVSGKHVITVLQQTQNGDFFDACCYIDITYGSESNFTPQGNPVTVVLPVYNTSELNITAQQNNDGSYTFTVEDSNSGRVYTKYTWLLDSTLLPTTGTTLELDSSQIERLTMGSHLITLVAQTSDGEYFDAQCYIKKYENEQMPDDYKLLAPVIYLSGKVIKWAAVPYATSYKIYKYSCNEDLDTANIDFSLFSFEQSTSIRKFSIPKPDSQYDYYVVKTSYRNQESEEISNVVKVAKENYPELTESHNGTYYFTENDGVWCSNNQGLDGTVAQSQWSFSSSGTIEIDWSVSSESGFDNLTITVNGIIKVNNASGSDSGTISISSDSETIIVATYSKDGSSSNGSDSATLTFRF